MTRERARSTDQSSFWTLGTAEAAGETAQAAHGFPGTWRNASVRNIPRVHLGNVGLMATVPPPAFRVAMKCLLVQRITRDLRSVKRAAHCVSLVSSVCRQTGDLRRVFCALVAMS